MTSLAVIGWFISCFLVLVGGFVWVLCGLFRPFNYAEINGMKQGGRFEDEPEYMRQFRVTRAEFDLESNLRHSRYAAISTVAGITGIMILVGNAMFSWF